MDQVEARFADPSEWVNDQLTQPWGFPRVWQNLHTLILIVGKIIVYFNSIVWFVKELIIPYLLNRTKYFTCK